MRIWKGDICQVIRVKKKSDRDWSQKFSKPGPIIRINLDVLTFKNPGRTENFPKNFFNFKTPLFLSKETQDLF